MKFRTGDLVQLRNGKCPATPLQVMSTGMVLLGDRYYTSQGRADFMGDDHPTDIVTIITPGPLPIEPFELYVNFYPDGRKHTHRNVDAAFRGRGSSRDGQTWRCLVTPLEQIKL